MDNCTSTQTLQGWGRCTHFCVFWGALSTFTATKVQTTVVHKGLTPNVLELILLAFSFFFSFFLMSRAVECDLQYLRCVLVFVGVLFDYL